MNIKFACGATFLETIMREDFIRKKNEYKKQFGEVVKKKRKRVNITQKELASELGVKNTTISRYEKGETDMPASVLPIICDICRFDFNEYMYGMDALGISKGLGKSIRYVMSIKGAYPPLEWGKKEYEAEYNRLYNQLESILKTTDHKEILLYGKMLDMIKYSNVGSDDVDEIGIMIKRKLLQELRDKDELIDIVVKFEAVKHGLETMFD